MNRKVFLGASILTAAVAVAAVLVYFTRQPRLHGSVIDPPLPAAELSLTDFDGQPFLLTTAGGRVTMVYFGYTHCPDECPLVMANLRLAVESLGHDAARTRVVMVTTDPERDTPDVLRSFLGQFNDTFLGLTGSPDALARVWRDYGVTVLEGGRTHSNYIYVIDPSGNLVETLLPDALPSEIAADIRTLLKAN